MRTLAELQEFYQTTLTPQLDILEAERLKAVRNIYRYCVPVVLIGVLAAGFLVSQNLVQETFFAVIVAGGICAVIVRFQSRGYVSDFKTNIIAQLVKFFDSGLEYSAQTFIDEGRFVQSGIFRTQPNRYAGDDLVRGVLGATRVEFSEIHAQYVTRDSKGRTTCHTIFKGVFFIADFNKDFKGRTFVLTDSIEGLGVVGGWLQGMNRSRGELVKLEDPEFEKMFIVYSSDQIEARYILSTSLMSRITDFARKSGRRIQMSFTGSKVYIAIPYDRDLFEPRIFETILDFAPVQQYFGDLQLAAGIVEDLNLNLRIWSKS